MIEHHSVLRQELSRVDYFARKLKRAGISGLPATSEGSEEMLRDRPPVSSGPDGILQHVSMAFEDIPEDLHESVKMLLMRPVEDTSLRDAVTDVAMNVGGDVLGQIEKVTEQLTRLHLLASLSHHVPYTYKVDKDLLRGSRPTAEKLLDLYNGGCRATINLCAEMLTGDEDTIRDAKLDGMLNSYHIRITDNTPPSAEQVEAFVRTVNQSGDRVYVHCEAGVGRTGVMVACYRISRGWKLPDALQEATNFGCRMPDQLNFIQHFAAPTPAAGPAIPPTAEQLRQTVSMNHDPTGLQRAL